jgi:hypothetical protein
MPKLLRKSGSVKKSSPPHSPQQEGLARPGLLALLLTSLASALSLARELIACWCSRRS